MSMTRAWTLGYPPSYDEAVRIPGNGKAPGGYVFRTREDALSYAQSHQDEAGRYAPYQIILPAEYDRCVTRSWLTAADARHQWHIETTDFMPQCGICMPVPRDYAHDVLIVIAPFINPDTDSITPAVLNA